MVDLIKAFKAGPLDFYRSKASFNWRKLKLFLETEDVIKFENAFYEELQKYPEFKVNTSLVTHTLDDERRIVARQRNVLNTIILSSPEYTRFPSTACRIKTQFIPSAYIKYTVTKSLFINVIQSLGSDRHAHFIKDAENGKICGCYCLTEIGHGSNAKGMQTTATYNKDKKVFVLNCKDFQAAKCWAGGLGQSATHALVYAQLIANNVNHGLHCFVVPIRDPNTLLPYPGIIVGDLGEKIGLNGVDNGCLILNNYEIPRENLLNKLGDVTTDGQYITPYKDINKRHGAALGNLSGGRIMITCMCEANCTKALTIAIRYAAVRKQFGPNENTEVALLEYQTHQYRLLPYLAGAYVFRIFCTWLTEMLYQFSIDIAMGNNTHKQADLGIELHAISSASKPVVGWIAKFAIQECRETCGGHGYLKAAGIGNIRNDHDANLTYEGENYILIQQTSNWLLKLWPLVLNKKEFSSPLKSANFLCNAPTILKQFKFNITNVEDLCLPEAIINIYQWLICYLLKKTYTSLECNLKDQSLFWAKSSIQVFKAKNLSVAYIEHLMLQIMLIKIKETSEKPIKDVLQKLFTLFGLWSLKKHISSLYEGGFASGPQLVSLTEEAILKLCSDLKNDAVALIDAIAPPDFILNSVLGASDGEVYKRLQSAIFSSPYAMSRPSWWQEDLVPQKTVSKNMVDLIKSFKAGPLDIYRKKASFDWKKLKLFLETEDVIEFENEFYEVLQKYPEFRENTALVRHTFDDERRIAARQRNVLDTIKLSSLEYTLQNLRFPSTACRIKTQFIPSASIKHSVTKFLFLNVIQSLGTERHAHFINDTENDKICGCYCLTEIGHGSNAKGMQTTATYNKDNQIFVLNSKDFQAAKCWAGGLGQSATHALVYAQLIVNNVKHGLHCFVVPIRDPNTLLPYPGIIVGDMGEKIGLNGIDNGFLILNNYEIPRENLLNKLGDVTTDGQYITPYKDTNKRHGAALGNLSGGRIMITCMCEANCTKALTIAIRYAAVRKQFGPDENTEVALLEYQTHQYRLLPYLAGTYVFRIFSTWLAEMLYQFSIDIVVGNNKDQQADLGIELHAISSASKPVVGWITKFAIQECRETCGGHGYLKAAGIGNIRNDHDANLTYEGENYILIQQTSNWLLKLWPLVINKKEIYSPLKSVNFLTNAPTILKQFKFEVTNLEDLCLPEAIINIYQWLICYLLKKTYTSLEYNLKDKSLFWAKSSIQVFKAKNLSVAYIEHLMLQIMLNKINEISEKPIKDVLLKLFALFGLWSLDKHISSLYEGGFASGPQLVSLTEEAILKLCSDLKNDAVALIDAVAPPDFILNSVLGASDGEVYKRLQSAIFSSPYAMSRPNWWQEDLLPQKTVTKSKL